MTTRDWIEIRTPTEQRELARRAREGDVDAGRELTLSAMPYIWGRAGHGDDRDDLAQGAALMVLAEAIPRYDPSAPAEFLTYARWWVRRGIQRARADARIFHVRGFHKSERKSREARAETDPDYRARWEATKARVARMRTPPKSLSARAREGGPTLGDSLEARPRDEWRADLSEALERLEESDPRAAMIVRLRYLDGLLLREIAESVSLTCSRVQQISREGIEKLRELMGGSA